MNSSFYNKLKILKKDEFIFWTKSVNFGKFQKLKSTIFKLCASLITQLQNLGEKGYLGLHDTLFYRLIPQWD